MTLVHRPVLIEEVIHFLAAHQGGVFVDATFGGGGHTEAILKAHGDNRVLALDRDAESLTRGREKLGSAASRVEFIHTDYRRLTDVLEGRPAPAGLLADLGISSLQLLEPSRGFSFDREGPLDMRMDRSAGITAADLVNSLPGPELRRLIRQHGEERFAGPISRAIVKRRKQQPFLTTTELATVVRNAVPRHPRQKIDPATRTFQALRIAVNDELTDLARFVEDAAESVRPGGRLVFISFHSLEDRPVKHTLRQLANSCVCPPDLPLCACNRKDLVQVLTPKAVRPSDAEVEANPASRSSRLRAAERLAA